MITSSGELTLPSDNDLFLDTNLIPPVNWRINDTVRVWFVQTHPSSKAMCLRLVASQVRASVKCYKPVHFEEKEHYYYHLGEVFVVWLYAGWSATHLRIVVTNLALCPGLLDMLVVMRRSS